MDEDWWIARAHLIFELNPKYGTPSQSIPMCTLRDAFHKLKKTCNTQSWDKVHLKNMVFF